MQFIEDAQWIPIIGTRYQLGADGVSVLLILLTTLLGFVGALSSWRAIEKREKEYYVLLLLLQTAVVGVFASMDLFLFYVFFEVSLVPMYFDRHLGRRKSSVRGDQVFLYTLVGSVLMLLGVLKMYFLTQDAGLASQVGTATLDAVAGAGNTAARLMLGDASVAAKAARALSILCTCRRWAACCRWERCRCFCSWRSRWRLRSKCPCFRFTWLPDAHVEAPTAGSVILAGVLLKLGTYGFFRVALPMFPRAVSDEHYFGAFGVRNVIIGLALVSIVYGALAAMYFVVKRDGDVKNSSRIHPCRLWAS
jgi:NADH-quinone oxidoreductase subunit M